MFTGDEQETNQKTSKTKDWLCMVCCKPGRGPRQLGGLSRSSSFNCFLFLIQIYFLPCKALKNQQPHKGANLPAVPGLQSSARVCLPPPLLKLGSNKDLSIMLLLFKTITDNWTLIRLEQHCQKVSQWWLSQRDWDWQRHFLLLSDAEVWALSLHPSPCPETNHALSVSIPKHVKVS